MAAAVHRHEIDETQEVALEDGRITKASFDRLKIIEFGCMTMSLFGIGLSVMQYDTEYSESDTKGSSLILYLIFLSSVILSLMTVIRYNFYLEFQKKRNLISQRETLISTGAYKYLGVEILLIMIIPYPWLEGIQVTMSSLINQDQIYYHVNEFLSMLLMLRFFIVLRVILLTSVWNSNRAQRICEMYAVQPGSLFTLKCMMRTRPFVVVFAAILFSIPYFGYLLRIAERPFSRIVTSIIHFDYANSLWNIVETMTTVGYGDLYPSTYFGRTVIFFVCIWGTTTTSIMVVTLTNTLHMSNLEFRAFFVMRRLVAKEKLREMAAFIITNLMRAKQAAKKDPKVLKLSIKKLKNYLRSFRKAVRLSQEFSDTSSGFDEMQRQFEFLQDQIREVHRQEKYLIESNKLIMSVLGIDRNLLEKLDNNLKSKVFETKRSIISRGGVRSKKTLEEGNSISSQKEEGSSLSSRKEEDHLRMKSFGTYASNYENHTPRRLI